MAAVPYDGGVPSVQPAGAPANDYQRIDPPAAAFGSTQAQDLKESGANLRQASNELSSTALAIQDRYNQVAVQDAYNQLQTNYFNLTYGDPKDPTKKGIYALQGKDAMDAYPDTMQKLSDVRESTLGGLRNGAQRLAFEEASRRLQYLTQTTIGRHVDQESKTYGVATANAQGDLAAQGAALYYNDPGRLNDYATQSRNAAMSVVKTKYGEAATPAITEDAMVKSDSRIVQSAVMARAVNDPVSAKRMLETWTLPGHLPGDKPIPFSQALDAISKTALQEHVNARADQVAGGQAGTTAFNKVTGSGGPNTGPIAASDLPSEAHKFLPALSGGEGNYSSPAPTGDSSGTPIHNNRYQFLSRTWATEAPKAGVDVNDHSPAAQDKVAWNYAKNTYAANTGRNLQTDIAEGGHEPTIALALNKVWPSLPGGSQQNTSLPVWLNRMRAGAIPTTNNARQPLTGDQILQGQNDIDNDPTLTSPQAKHAAQTAFHQHVGTYNQALAADAQTAMNEYGPKIALNPTSVAPEDIWNDKRLTYAEKTTLSRQLTDEQSGKRDGDGARFQQIFQQSNLPVGDPQRINSVRDLIPHMGNGLTYAGMTKMTHWIGERDKPDGEVQKAAFAAWKSQIEGTPGGIVSPGPVSRAKWAQFLGAALPLIQAQQGKKSITDIVGPNGDIAKMVPQYVLRPEEIAANLGAGNFDNTPPNPAPKPTAPQQGPVQGQWYNRSGVRVAPGTTGAFLFHGGDPRDRANWLDRDPANPQAPH